MNRKYVQDPLNGERPTETLQEKADRIRREQGLPPEAEETGPRPCQWYDDGHGGRFLVPGCMERVIKAVGTVGGRCMSYRPYPNRKRALHQLDRHAYERRPQASPDDQLRAAIYRAYRLPPRLLGIRPDRERTA